jgi:hypothetical protein
MVQLEVNTLVSVPATQEPLEASVPQIPDGTLRGAGGTHHTHLNASE